MLDKGSEGEGVCLLGHIICDERPWEKGRISLAVMSRLEFAFWLPQLSPLPSIFSSSMDIYQATYIPPG